MSNFSQALAVINQFLGTPYRWSGNDTSGVDCSGFTRAVYKAMGIDLPRVSYQQANAGQQVSQAEAQPGDLVWWDLNGRNPGADHVGIYMGNGKVAEASSSRGEVVVRNLWGNAHFTRFGQGAQQDTMGSVRAQTAGRQPQDAPDTSRRDKSPIASLDTTASFGNLASFLDEHDLAGLRAIYARVDEDDPGEREDTVGPVNVARLTAQRETRDPDQALRQLAPPPMPQRPMVRPTADAGRFG